MNYQAFRWSKNDESTLLVSIKYRILRAHFSHVNDITLLHFTRKNSNHCLHLRLYSLLYCIVFVFKVFCYQLSKMITGYIHLNKNTSSKMV